MAENVLLAGLKRQIEDSPREIVAIVGTGVSIASVSAEMRGPASWIGLLKDGADRCEQLGVLDEKAAQLLHQQIEADDLDFLLSAAETIQRKLGGPTGGEFKSWLRKTVGGLAVANDETISAIVNLGVVIATTNYDNLIGDVTGRRFVTWRNGSEVERVLRGEETKVLHIHGHWEEPESVILGIRDYGRILADGHAQTMERAMRSLKTLLFIGCGAGLEDPNFGALIEWSKNIFQGSEYRHYILCREPDLVSFRERFPIQTRIFPISYGPNHGDLAGFVRSLSATVHSVPVKEGAERKVFGEVANSTLIPANKLDVMTSVLLEIKRGKKEFSPDGSTKADLEEFQLKAKALVAAEKRGFLGKLVVSQDSSEGDLFYDLMIVLGGMSFEGEEFLASQLSGLKKDGKTVEYEEIYKTLNQLPQPQLVFLTTLLRVPRNMIPGSSANANAFATVLMDWAEMPGGCGLAKLKQELDELIHPR